MLPNIVPPFRQLETRVLGDFARKPAVVGDAIVVPQGKACLALDARSLKPRWKKILGGEVEVLSPVGGELVASGTGRLDALDPRTGAVRWSLPRKGPGAPAVGGGGRVYTSLAPYGLSAMDGKTHRVVWSKTLSKAKPRGFSGGKVEGLALEGNTLLVAFDTTLYSLDATTGRTLWSRPQVYLFDEPPAVAEGVAWINGEGLDVRTGKPRWQVDHAEVAAVYGGRFVGIGHGRLMAVEPRTGRVLWSQGVGPKDTSGGNQYVAWLGDGVVARGISGTVGVGLEGKVRWSLPSAEAIDRPIWSDAKTFVCWDGSCLMRYTPGADEAIPTDPAARRALAARMVAGFDKLDPAGVRRLRSLGDEAFEPILQAFLKACAAYDAAGERGGMDLYSRYHDLAESLDATVSAKRTGELIDALKKAKPEGAEKPFLLGMLAKVGDENVTIPYFLKELRGATPGFEMYESNTFVARRAVVASSHPDAVAFMIEKLKDPKADPVLRDEAYRHLAGTGGEAGLRAVLSERPVRELLPPVETRMKLWEIGKKGALTTILATRGGWGLAKSGVLGSGGDLWLLQRKDGGWRNPLFVGVSLDGISRWAKTNDPPPTAFGKTAKALTGGAWFDTLVGRPELALDTDADGLTDIMEARLGTDPQKADTDGDGDLDATDPWPTVAARPATDEEKVLGAAFEARHHFQGYSMPGVFFALEGNHPVEMAGWRGPVLVAPTGDGFTTPLQRCYEQGVGFLRFAKVDWNRERTEATLTVSTYFGGLSGDGYSATVRKFGEDWVVVKMDMAYLS